MPEAYRKKEAYRNSYSKAGKESLSRPRKEEKKRREILVTG